LSVVSFLAAKGTLEFKRFQRFGPTRRNLRIRAPLRRVWGRQPLRWMLYPAETTSASLLRLRDKPHTELQWMC
jgi:hypothetical protein